MIADERLTQGVLPLRITAFVLDAVIIGLLWGLVWLGFAAFTVMTLGLGAGVFRLIPLFPFAYNWLTVAGFGRTPGQAMCGLKVRRNRDLDRPSGVEALVWTVGYYVLVAPAVMWLEFGPRLGFFGLGPSALIAFIALVTPRNRTVYDLVSGLVVVRADRLTHTPPSWNIGALDDHPDAGGPRFV